MEKTLNQLRAENHANRHVSAVTDSDLGRIFREIQAGGLPCELICREASDFDSEDDRRSRYRAINERLHDTYPVHGHGTLAAEGPSARSGFWSADDMQALFSDLLGSDEWDSPVYVLGETMEGILAARARDIAPRLESLHLAAGSNDLFILEQDARWILQFTRHGKFIFARAV